MTPMGFHLVCKSACELGRLGYQGLKLILFLKISLLYAKKTGEWGTLSPQVSSTSVIGDDEENGVIFLELWEVTCSLTGLPSPLPALHLLWNTNPAGWQGEGPL